MKEGQLLISIGKKIRQARKEKGISMRDLAKICPLYKSSISEIENGKRNSHILTLKLIADAIGVDLKDFL